MRLPRGVPAVPSSLLALGLALSTLLAGCTSFTDSASKEAASTASPSAATEATPIEWTDCNEQIQPLIANQPGSDRQLAFECGRTEVPISYDEPDGAKLPLVLIRARAAAQTDKIGSLVVNPGGPGVSGTDAAIALALTLPPEVLSRFDLVGFDPRGVGLSTPVECIPDATKEKVMAAEPRPTSEDQLDDALGLAKDVAAGCSKEYGQALGTFNTVDTARDMDRIRASLGDDKLTYLGYSYGTTLGSTYAELFPDKVRALVLDGAVDPKADAKTRAESRAQALEAGFDAFAQNCVGLIAGCPIGADPRAFVEQLLAQAAATPIPSSDTTPSGEAETRQATPGVVMTALRAALDDPAAWPQLAQALATGQQGNSAGLFSLADGYSGRLEDGTFSNQLDANLAISCADSDETVKEGEVRDLAAQWGQKYPLFGAGTAVSLYSCSVWEADRTPLPDRDAEGSAPILVVGNSGDPVTPLPGAQNMADSLDSGVLLIWQGTGHTSYPKNQCIVSAVNSYLIDLTPPMDGLTCPA